MSGLAIHQKVFGIGLSRTGTTSLSVALNTLGIRTIHYPCDERTFEELTRGNYKLSVLEEYQGVADTPVVPYYAQFDRLYPGSRFILTVREKVSWLRSCKDHWEFTERWAEFHQQRKFVEFIRACVYGLHGFQEDRFSNVYDLHLRNVTEYFRGREKDFLVIDICGGEGWDKLCPFLGLPIPSVAFPRSNTAADKGLAQAWLARLEQLRAEIVSLIPVGDLCILVDEDQRGARSVAGRRTVPFLERAGEYWGPPENDETAIRELERLRQGGANFLAFAWPAFWWLDYYSAFHQHLRSRFRCLLENERLVIFDLRQ